MSVIQQQPSLEATQSGCGCSPECGTACRQRYVCRCLRITESELAETIVSLRVCSFEQLRQCSEAGDGCTACHQRLREMVERYACPGSSSALPMFSAK